MGPRNSRFTLFLFSVLLLIAASCQATSVNLSRLERPSTAVDGATGPIRKNITNDCGYIVVAASVERSSGIKQNSGNVPSSIVLVIRFMLRAMLLLGALILVCSSVVYAIDERHRHTVSIPG